jgi:6-phospho-beta-glucosidase
MKLVVLGGGGVRSPFLAKSLALQANSVGIKSIVFVDTNEEKLNIYGTLSKEIFKRLNSTIEFSITTNSIEALIDANYIITTIRVGEELGRVSDEKIALKYGVLGQETTGPGGFAYALRTIPVILDYCQMIEKYSHKDAVVFNFTNPAGIVTQAIHNSGFSKKFFGICDAPSELIRQIAEVINEDEENLEIDCFGLNHLSWFKNIRVKGINITQKVISNPRIYRETEMKYFNKDLVHLLDDMLLNEYLYYYYNREQAIESILNSDKTRGEQILDINTKMFKKLKKLNLKENLIEAFEIYFTALLERENSYMAAESGIKKENKREVISLQKFLKLPDSGGYAGVAMDILRAIGKDSNKRIVISTTNNGTLDFLKDDDVIEISCTITSNGEIKPIKMENIPPLQANLIKTVKLYENLTVEAIFEKNTDKAIKALMVHPLVNSYSLAKNLVSEYFEANKKYMNDWN